MQRSCTRLLRHVHATSVLLSRTALPPPPPRALLSSADQSASWLVRRARRRFRKYWRSLTSEIAAPAANAPVTAASSPSSQASPVSFRQLERAEHLLGKISTGVDNSLDGQVLARELAECYLTLDATERARFVSLLASGYGVDRASLSSAVAAFDPLGELSGLRSALLPRFDRLFQLVRQQPGGMKWTVDLRADVLSVLQHHATPSDTVRRDLAELDMYLHGCLSSWFSPGALELVRISWRDSPAAMLERIMRYERVHPMAGWNDVRQRVGPGRRCFAFVHPAMRDEPLVFVQVALEPAGLASSVQAVLGASPSEADEQAARAAVFYSISATQAGLARIELGQFLIKRVVQRLLADVPSLSVFGTLSPIPGFMAWLRQAPESTVARYAAANGGAATTMTKSALLARLAQPGWHVNADADLRDQLMRLCAAYLAREQRPVRTGVRQAAADPVANFHLRNGARIERLNWLADVSPAGLNASAGMLVNYRYVLSDMHVNNDAYEQRGSIAMAPDFAGLLRESP